MPGIANLGLLRRSIFPKKAHGIPAARHTRQLSHGRLQQDAPCSLINLPGNHSSFHAVFYKLPCDFGRLPCVLPSLTRFWQAPAQPCQTAMPYVTLLCSFAKPPCDFGKLPCGFAGFCATPLDSPRSGCRQISPAAVPRCFRIFLRHRTKPPLLKAIGFSPLCRLFDDALSSF